MLFRSLVALALASVSVAVALPQGEACLAGGGSICMPGANEGIFCCELDTRCVITGTNPEFGTCEFTF
ncbi:hypothetical protein SCHPADRAFT_618521 [Schizopora paradoxa]|uniref:CBM1 domain-containing protein n=1 Tax=Schizopora paradoxa TaxID=27342 RepID=A0A0H2R8N2_9AGAM|nr:hypothetical protein SCHPADRAFT_618521 [Schizopora paradoxa]